jgi:hypothetical protein
VGRAGALSFHGAVIALFFESKLRYFYNYDKVIVILTKGHLLYQVYSGRVGVRIAEVHNFLYITLLPVGSLR